jgi:hypothetical protein
MNSVAFQDQPATRSHESEQFQYRSVSKAAISSLVFAVFGLTSFVSPIFVVLPALGAGLGLVALANFKRFPDELVGKLAAQIGLVVSVVCLLASIALHSYVYATEVPEGYQRINFGLLRNNPKTALPFAENAKKLDGKKVFLKGYVRPGAKKTKLKNFIMVGDFGDCCFGGSPKITEVVAVDIKIDKTVNYSYALRRIAGTFKLNPNSRRTNEKDVPQVFYELHADHVN